MSYDNENIFAKIIRGEFGCIKVYEDDHVIAFMDIMPQADGHTLIVPKEAAETLSDLSDDGAAAAIKVVKKIVGAVKVAMDVPAATVMQLNGSEAGQTVPHIHFHVIPGSILGGKPHAREMADQELLKGFADKIIAALG
ncbi:HIT family protein [Gammaproteobacteria bacterium 45_16_T64]|nr:HIT family protein [Gammaproteobacteria bacterium 45_16_T64]